MLPTLLETVTTKGGDSGNGDDDKMTNDESEDAKFNRLNPTFGPGCCSNNELPKEVKKHIEDETKDLLNKLDRHKNPESNIFSCVGCGFSVKGQLNAFSDGMGAGMRRVCKNKIILCQNCIKEIAHSAIDL